MTPPDSLQDSPSRMNTSTSQSSTDVSLTYKFLLIFSTLAAVFFCWLYVTKPTQIIQASPLQTASMTPLADNHNPTTKEGTQQHIVDAPSLPGLSSAENKEITPSNANDGVELAPSDSTTQLVGYEETNDAIQHVLIAKSESTSERIILEVPVIYQTRGLRFSPAESNEAGRILRALKIYHSQIKKLHTDGVNIQKAWDQLLIKSQPIEALRADSPSLPQNTGTHSSLLQENSATTIKVSR